MAADYDKKTPKVLGYTVTERESMDEDDSDLEARFEDGQKYSIGVVDAEFAGGIVRAVNLHDRLVKAVEELTEMADDAISGRGGWDVELVLDDARRVLSEAKPAPAQEGE